MKRLLAAVVAVVFVGLFAGCTVNPATGQRQFNTLSESSEIELGQKSAPEFLKSYGGAIESPEIRVYVSDMGKRLAAQGERPDLPWTFNVVDSALLNAFALPGGQVFISRGLLVKLTNEAQLAAVLGHEIGHITAQHAGQQKAHGMIIQGVGVLISVIGQESDKDWMKYVGVGTTVGGTLYLLRFSRNHEDQADTLGLRYMTRLDYSPVGMRQLMELFDAESQSGGADRVVWLSTHPLPRDRIERVDQLIKERYPEHGDPNKYRFNVERYKTEVLDRLATLPPPKHNPKSEPKKKE